MDSRSAHQARLLAEALGPCVQSCGVELESVDLAPIGRRTRVRITVDSDTGVDLDAIAAVSQAVSAHLDDPQGAGRIMESVTGSAAYTLEVTSPGVDRPLTASRHWRRNIGRLVSCTLVGGASVRGRIRAVEDDHAVVDVDGAETSIVFGDVQRATVEIEFTRPAESERR